jgi:sterol 3beta-glucosyltransferase
MTETIFDAVKKAGVRALVSAGWGGLGGTSIPDEVFILEGERQCQRETHAKLNQSSGNIPHDWLFADDRVTAVCHHGGG